jgi:hypothetical protein
VNFSFGCPPQILPPIGKSDHCVVVCRERSRPRPAVRKVSIRKFSSSRRALLHDLIFSIDWLALVKSAGDINSCASFLFDSLFALFEYCFPLRVVRFQSSDPPWMKPSLKILIDDRDRAFCRGQTQKYFRLRNEVMHHTQQLKELFLKGALSLNDSRSSWKSLKLIGRHSRPSYPENSVEQLNSHFVSNFQVTHESVPFVPSDLPSFPLTVSTNEVCALLKSLKNKSPGPDGIPVWLLRDFAYVLSPAITFLFNWSLETGQMPLCFKVANVTPVPKSSPAVEPANFRPISLLPILSKVLERIVAKKWVLPIISPKLHTSQFAYIPGGGKGTSSALTLLHHDVVKFLDTSGCVRILSIDFAKAFDKILHSMVIEKLVKLNLPSEAISWISDFLTDRFQRVKVRDKVSSWQPVISGVPQGSVLGPILFCVFIDSLHSVCTNSLTYKYADDINIVHFVRQQHEDNLQLEYDNVLEWSHHHKLPINESKCCVLNITTKKALVPTSISGPNGLLPQVPTLRILGVTFSQDLRWNTHVDNVLKKANKRIYFIRNLKRAGCPHSTILMVYNSVIRSQLLYAYSCFCNLKVYLQEKLLKFERRVFRMAGMTNEVTVIEAGETICQTLFQKVSSTQDHCLRQCFSQRETCTRQSLKLRPIKAKTSRLSQSFTRFAR